MYVQSNFVFPLATNTWDESEIGAIHRVIDSDRFTMGPEVLEFERQFSEYFGSKHAIMVNSGSSANLLSAFAMRYVKGGKYVANGNAEVIVPAVSWSTTYFPLSQAGFKLVFVDVDEVTLNIDLNATKLAINSNTVGIMAVNLLGNPSSLSELRALADENNLFLIEDNCEALGASLDEKYTGTYGDVGTFSTFYSHHIATMEGGVIVTDDLEIAQIVRSLRAHGWTRELPQENLVSNKSGDAFVDSFTFVLPGFNVRPLEMEGAIGQCQIQKIEDIVSQRRKNSLLYIDLINELSGFSGQGEHGQSSWFSFAFILRDGSAEKRNQLMSALALGGVETRPVMAGNMTRQPVMKHLDFRIEGTLVQADRIHDRAFLIGNHAYPLEAEFNLVRKIISSHN